MSVFLHNNVLTWNAGRQYSSKGQRMSAVRLTTTGRVAFLDADRGIEGVTLEEVAVELLPEPLMHFVMTEYDAGRYQEGFFDVPEIMSESHSSFSEVMKEAALNQEKKCRVLFKNGTATLVFPQVTTETGANRN